MSKLLYKSQERIPWQIPARCSPKVVSRFRGEQISALALGIELPGPSQDLPPVVKVDVSCRGVVKINLSLYRDRSG